MKKCMDCTYYHPQDTVSGGKSNICECPDGKQINFVTGEIIYKTKESRCERERDAAWFANYQWTEFVGELLNLITRRQCGRFGIFFKSK